MEKRTIILLSAPRCGSTAIFRIFQKHPDVGICDEDPTVFNCEPHFWSLAEKAIAGKPEKLEKKLHQTLPSISLPEKYTEKTVFALWDSILEAQGPIVFDKSPYYLGNRRAMELLHRYIQRGNVVRMFAMIRDPRDAITSQYELWASQFKIASPATRERIWLDQYAHLEELQMRIGYIPLFRYEDLAAAPACYVPMIFKHCGIRDFPYTYKHIMPVSVGRKSASLFPKVRRWKISESLKKHAEKYGYMYSEDKVMKRMVRFAVMFPGNVTRLISSKMSAHRIRRKIKNAG